MTQPTKEQLEAILDTVFECGWEAGERYKEAKGGTTDVSDTLFKAKQDITALIQEAVVKGQLKENTRRGNANTKLANLLSESVRETSQAPGLSEGEKQVVLMALSKVKRWHQEVERLRIKERKTKLENQLSGGSNNE